MESNRRSSRNIFVPIALLGLVLIFIASLAGVGYFGYKYYGKSLLNKSVTNSSSSKTPRDFTSATVFEPTGNVIDLVKTLSPSVVTVVSKTQSASLFTGEEQETQGTGTGFFVSEDGLLITNQHVVCDSTSPENITIVTSADKSYTVDSIAADPTQDIAIVKVNTKGEKVSYLKFANTDSKLLVGEDVLAIGNPLGVNPGSVTKGIISGLERNIQAQGSCGNKTSVKDYEGVIQTDAAINPGNSGGPMLNLKGEVIGINSATSSDANNISYAVPFDRAVKLLARYEAGNGKLTFPYIGVSYSMLDANVAKTNDVPVGAFVRQVLSGSPADAAGIKKNDIITKLGDKKIEFSLQSTLNQYFQSGQKVKIEVYRPNLSTLFGEQVNGKGQTVTLDLTIGEK